MSRLQVLQAITDLLLSYCCHLFPAVVRGEVQLAQGELTRLTLESMWRKYNNLTTGDSHNILHESKRFLCVSRVLNKPRKNGSKIR